MDSTAPVLFLTTPPSRPWAALWRASLVAQAAKCPLRVVVCQRRGVPGRRSPVTGESVLALSAWCDRHAQSLCGAVSVRPFTGTLAAAAEVLVPALGPRLIVLSRFDRVRGRLVAALVERWRTPVLLSRVPLERDRAIAADGFTARHPIALEAKTIVRLLAGGQPPPQGGSPASLPPTAMTAQEATKILGEVDTELLENPETVEALLELTRDQEADLVLVGQPPRGGLGRWLSPSPVARLVERSGHSLLVVPLSGEER